MAKLAPDGLVSLGGEPPSHTPLVNPSIYGDHVESATALVSATALKGLPPQVACPAVHAAAVSALERVTHATLGRPDVLPGGQGAAVRVAWRGGCHVAVACLPLPPAAAHSGPAAVSLWMHGFLFGQFQRLEQRARSKLPLLAVLAGGLGPGEGAGKAPAGAPGWGPDNLLPAPAPAPVRGGCEAGERGGGAPGRLAPQWLPTASGDGRGDFVWADQHVHYVGDSSTGPADEAEADRPGWACGVCTLRNVGAGTTACEVCGAPRGATAPASGHLCFGSDMARVAPADPAKPAAFWLAAVDLDPDTDGTATAAAAEQGDARASTGAAGILACVVLLPAGGSEQAVAAATTTHELGEALLQAYGADGEPAARLLGMIAPD